MHRPAFAPRLAASAVALLAGCATADERASPYTFGGLAFGDLYHVPGHHLPQGDGATGAVLRRAYLTGNADFGNGWFGRLRVEVNQSGEFETYDFEADFKDAYAGYRFGNHTVMLGLQPTLTFDVIESSWGMRYLARTPTDLQGIPSRDAGISVKGRIDETWSYRVMFGDGDGAGDGAIAMAALNWRINDRWMVDVYADHGQRPGPADITTGQLFAFYESEQLRFGAQYTYRDREEDPRGELASAFVVAPVGAKVSAVGRIDRLIEPSIEGDDIAYIPIDPGASATLYLAGLEYRWSGQVRVTPNAVVVAYDRDDTGGRPDADIYLRLTMYADFE